MNQDMKPQIIANEEHTHQTLPEAQLAAQKQPTTTKPRVVIVGAGFGGPGLSEGFRAPSPGAVSGVCHICAA